MTLVHKGSCVHWQSLYAKKSATAAQSQLYLPWPPWVTQHPQDYFYLCHIAQGGQGKYNSDCRISLSLVFFFLKNINAFIFILLRFYNFSSMVTLVHKSSCVHWQSLYVKMSATAACDNHNCTCLGHLGRHKIDRIIFICVMSPKVAKASTIVTVAFHCRWCFCLTILLQWLHFNSFQILQFFVYGDSFA